MTPIKSMLIAALLPLAISACSDSSDSKDENPLINPAPIDEAPNSPMPDTVTPPVNLPVPQTPQQPDTIPSAPTNPDTESPAPDPVSNNPTPTVGNPIANSEWRSCYGESTSVLNQYTFTDTEYSFVYATYDASGCQGPPDTYSEINGGTYTLGNTVTTTDGLPAIEFNMFNTRLLGVEAGEKSQYQYNIIHVNGDVMYLGAQPEYKEVDRPQALDFDDEYRRFK